MGVLSVPVGDAGLSQLVGLRPRMEDPLPGDLSCADAFRYSSHACGAKVCGVGKDACQHGWNVLRWFPGADMRELIGKLGPRMNLHQAIVHLYQRVHVTELPFQLLSGG
jgi:hypothetical protein